MESSGATTQLRRQNAIPPHQRTRDEQDRRHKPGNGPGSLRDRIAQPTPAIRDAAAAKPPKSKGLPQWIWLLVSLAFIGGAVAKVAPPPRMKPTEGIGMPRPGEITLQEQFTETGRTARWLHDVMLVPIITIISIFVLLGVACAGLDWLMTKALYLCEDFFEELRTIAKKSHEPLGAAAQILGEAVEILKTATQWLDTHAHDMKSVLSAAMLVSVCSVSSPEMKMDTVKPFCRKVSR